MLCVFTQHFLFRYRFSKLYNLTWEEAGIVGGGGNVEWMNKEEYEVYKLEGWMVSKAFCKLAS